MVTAPSERYVYDLTGGRVCLDFANTVSYRGSENSPDHLRSYGDLIAFGDQTGIVSPAVARELAKQAAAHPAAARDALARALAVREALFRMFVAIAASRRPRPADLALLNDHVPAAFARGRLAAARDRFVLQVEPAPDDLLSLLAPIVKSAVDLLSADEVVCVRDCGTP